jgi:hypothetical protein
VVLKGAHHTFWPPGIFRLALLIGFVGNDLILIKIDFWDFIQNPD